MEQKTTQELNLVVLPNGTLHLEWMDTQDAITKSSGLLQKEIYEQFSDKADLWLLFLGFSDPQIALPPSLDYWRNFAGSFAKKLYQTPDLEALRHQVRILLTEEELETHLTRVPMMTGAEYLRKELLEALWTRLSEA